jgi:glutathione synthase/RimK-type ligase-like ATP-grasp enzyme
MTLKFAGIKRKEIYSPNHVTNDAMILLKTAEVLQELGEDVSIYDEGFIEKNPIEEQFIFTMAQGAAGLHSLKKLEDEGRFIINKPSCALNTYRIQMIHMLVEAGVPFPKSIIVNGNDNIAQIYDEFGIKKLWIKRGDVHAEHKEDVTKISSKEELTTLYREFKKRGINTAVIQEHLPGDTIKFYGVLGTDFLHYYYPNGNNGYAYDATRLKELAFASAEILGVDVFGGDVIVSPEGKITIIDINDWPSFAPVRDEAAKHIGQIIHKKALHYEKH